MYAGDENLPDEITSGPAPEDDARCSCGVNHTVAEHGYDPDLDEYDPDDFIDDDVRYEGEGVESGMYD